MEYIREGSVLPIPFNIMPTPSLVYESLCMIFGGKKEIPLKFENFSSANIAPKLNIKLSNANIHHHQQNGNLRVFLIIFGDFF